MIVVQHQRGRLDRVVKTASNIVGSSLTPPTAVHNDTAIERTGNIISDQTHPTHHLFELLTSGKRLNLKHQYENKALYK